MWSDITTGPETQIWLCVTKKYSGLHYSDKMSNRVEFIRDFIEIYQSFPCLWKIKSPEYCNREKRKEGYSKLIEFYHLHAPEEQANEAVIKKKIQALRTVWRKELNKVLHTTKSGASTEEVYVPKLWYFEHMNFLRDQEVPRTSTCFRSLAPVEQTVSENLVEQDSQGQQVPLCTTGGQCTGLCTGLLDESNCGGCTCQDSMEARFKET
ncbi:uncharacterized protein [Ranitomeya imitator]|uniref:uncharacterized protein isoform X3 n=1 Tax=Ranitomeya imitator TaxID=111125 RepID=UPI0037E7A42C